MASTLHKKRAMENKIRESRIAFDKINNERETDNEKRTMERNVCWEGKRR